MTKILFICMGNICRSPTAEAIMQAIVNRSDISNQIFIDSCATHGYHVGHQADARMMKHAKLRGYELTSMSRQFDYPQDFNEFDYIIVMDGDNYTHITALDLDKTHHGKIHKMTDFCREIDIDHLSGIEDRSGGTDNPVHIIRGGDVPIGIVRIVGSAHASRPQRKVSGVFVPATRNIGNSGQHNRSFQGWIAKFAAPGFQSCVDVRMIQKESVTKLEFIGHVERCVRHIRIAVTPGDTSFVDAKIQRVDAGIGTGSCREQSRFFGGGVRQARSADE